MSPVFSLDSSDVVIRYVIKSFVGRSVRVFSGKPVKCCTPARFSTYYVVLVEDLSAEASTNYNLVGLTADTEDV